jgi:hypothetical protein
MGLAVSFVLCLVYWAGAMVQAIATEEEEKLFLIHFVVGVIAVITIVALIAKGLAAH